MNVYRMDLNWILIDEYHDIRPDIWFNFKKKKIILLVISLYNSIDRLIFRRKMRKRLNDACT